MLKHVFMMRFKDEYEGMNKEEIMNKFIEMLERLKGKIDEIKGFDIGKNVNTERPIAYDLVLYSTFEDNDALNIYLVHPEHLKVVEFAKKVVKESALVDYIE